jgi:YVTN family beta-propeller protein
MNRLLWICPAVVFAAIGRLAAQQHQLVFVENTRGGDVSVIDDATLKVVGAIDVGLSPDDIVPSPDQKTLFLARMLRQAPGRPAAPGEALGEMVAIDPRAQKVLWRTNLTGTPNHLMASPDGRFVYVTIVDRGHVDVVDVSRRMVVDTIAVGTGPHDIEISADGRKGWVGLILGAAAVAFDATTRRATLTFPMPQNVRPIAVTSDERTMYLQLSRTHGFAVLDLETGQTRRTVPMPVPPGQTLPDSMPETADHGLRITPDGKTLIANGSMYDLVAFYSLPDLALLGTVSVGRDPNWVTLTPDGKHVYVSNRGSNDVSVIDVGARKEIARIQVGKYPQRMASVTVGAP